MYNWKSYVVHNNAATTQLLLPDEKIPPHLRKIITSTSISISQVYSSLTVCINECKALVAKKLVTKFLDLYLHLDQGILQLLLSFSLIYSSNKT